jgi:hypothetical protein
MSEVRDPATEVAVSDDSQPAERTDPDPAALPTVAADDEPDSSQPEDGEPHARRAGESGTGGPGPEERAAPAPDDAGARAEWFLRTGRAGLLPESMTESEPDSSRAAPRRATAGAPPWAGDQAGPITDAPPPWESGPWPGPAGEEAGAGPRAGAGPERQRGEPSYGDRHYGERQSAAMSQPAGPASPAAADTGNWQAWAAGVAGLLPVVVPGLVLGLLGLRRARVTGTGRAGSWLAIACSAIWAVILVVWLVSAGGTAASACGNYQNVVGYPVSQVLHDLATSAPAGVVDSDLQKAISQANSAAASAQQVTARNAMATLTTSLQQVAGEQTSTSDAVMRQQVKAAAATMASACKA